MIVPRIFCARCNKEVDHAAFWRVDYDYKFEVVVQCHGEEQRSDLTDNYLMSLGREGVDLLLEQGGTAFAPRPTGANPPQQITRNDHETASEEPAPSRVGANPLGHSKAA